MPTALACDSCFEELPVGARFCPACGASVADDESESLSTGASAELTTIRESRRERKVATFLFADLVGFTDMGEEHDPELVSSVVAAAFERLTSEVSRHEGTLEKFAGDALLAVFGVPIAHEDDAERAVRAALEMQTVMADIGVTDGKRPTLALRIGIETGEVLVDEARAAEERDLFVTGDAVNTAARLQSAAVAGEVVVGPSTYGASHDVIDYEGLPSLELKGKSVPVPTWRAVAVKADRGSRRVPQWLESPLVGREVEMTLLRDIIGRAVADVRPHLVTVIGSAGVGKSRLARELEKYLDGLPEIYLWRKGRCLAYSGPSFGPIVELVKSDARILDDDPSEVAQEKLAARLSELHLGADEDRVHGALEAVLAIGERRDWPQEELFEAWRRYLRSIARTGPLVIGIEDIHWADEGVLSFVDFLARWGEGPITILCLARQELLERRPGWGGGLPNASTIDLEPLEAAASAELMDGLVKGGVPGALRDRVLELAEGNPLFAEEMVRMLVDRGMLRFADGRWQLTQSVDEVEIPDSVHAVLAARLDTLPEEEKRVALDAAVVGRAFWDRLVAHLSGDDPAETDRSIRGLQAKGLVVSREPSSFAGSAEFGFRHVFIRDVAYDSLPKRDRAVLHRDIARWMEAELGDRIGEFAEAIASHLAAALGYAEEFAVDGGSDLGELREAAYVATLKAARRASEMSQLANVGHWLHLAVDLARKLGLPAREVAVLAEDYSEAVLYVTPPEDRAAVASGAIDDLLSLKDRTEADEQLLARLRVPLAKARYDAGDVADAGAVLRQGLDALEPGPATSGRARLRRMLGWTYWRSGSLDKAVATLELAVAEAEASEDAEILRWAKHDLGICHGLDGRYDEAVEILEESHRQALEAADHRLIARCASNLPDAHRNRGDDLGPIAAMAEEGLWHARRVASVASIPLMAGNLASYMSDMGRLEKALAYADEAASAAASITPADLKIHLASRAIVHRLRGDVAAATRDETAVAGLVADIELQGAGDHLLGQAWAKWPQDPATTVAELASAMASTVMFAPDRTGVAHEAARMAFRLGDRLLLEDVVDQHQRSRRPGAPALLATYRWIDALLADSGTEIEAAAADLENLGYIRWAFDAWADAALIAARAGRASGAQERAIAIATTTGLHALLGPLPETRWLESVKVSEASLRS